jgi:stage II sporulation protein M
VPSRLTFYCCLIATMLFVAGGLVGFVMAPESVEGFSPVADSGARGLPEKLADLSFILSTNYGFAFRLMAGVFTLGAYSAFAMVTFGLQLGGFLSEAGAGLAVPEVLALMVPHGMFELPALMLVASLEFQTAFVVGLILFGRPPDLQTALSWARRLAQQALVSLAVLALAATIEAFVTGEVYEFIR